ncbi:hypothetical protein PF005_g18801 [Phytophthora fragariae]|uniref:Uncharacterized protein n=1 Tax=Phytophthora fragariae TaxID=53985 RepID=A0A6A3IH68_9STRA|nr:hypothetical protein PF003_g6044 [Phytophthora fragariae]KAE8925877.1 hypothetical protein PF009_g23922 [Phytophthora fragariae]KAE8981520.1 hypothetical protein PF011_g21984 [Phytophthora fragariae]KAE9092805.1 hypothetical protein PF007_g18344 [Phytophthora fragariae]KAE9092908.1 hypothetical protein PF010_g17687 [Phytophthora fragariae]
MTNAVLFTSTVMVGAVHILALLWYRQTSRLLAATIVAGLATSVWNHGVTSATAKVSDRLAMWLCFCVDLHLVWSLENRGRCWLCIATLVGAAILYGAAKVYIQWKLNTQVAGVSNDLNKQRPVSSVRRLRSGDVPHLLAHMSLTITHLLLVEAYSQLH